MTEHTQTTMNTPTYRLRYRKQIATAVALACGFAAIAANALPVIPNANGHGTDTVAGRGGTVYRVTTLTETGPGSIRACVDASGPRVCVFEISGTIRLARDLIIRNPRITIAGQTAPSPGIMLRGGGLRVKTSDVLVQHIRVRPGDDPGGEPPDNRDALKIEGDLTLPAPLTNIVIDHCSFSWSIDEVASAWQNWNNISLTNNIVAEPLNDSIHPKGNHGYGMLLGPVNGSATVAGNLIADAKARNPMTAARRAVFVNNVIYNWGEGAMDLQSRGDVTQNSVVGNVFIPGPNTRQATAIGLRADSAALRPGSRIFLSDNSGQAATASDPWSIAGSIFGSLRAADFRSNAPLNWPAGMTTLPTSENVVLNTVLRNVGARPADRDAVDARIVREVRDRSGSIINCVAPNGTARCNLNGGGWPSYAENRRTLTLPENPNTVTASGYTNLELWLQSMAAQVEGRSERAPQAPVLAEQGRR